MKSSSSGIQSESPLVREFVRARYGLRHAVLDRARMSVNEMELQILLSLDRRLFRPVVRVREALCVDSLSFSQAHRRLCAVGLIEESANPKDRRSKRMRLRPGGAQVATVARARNRELYAALRALTEFGRWTRARREAERP